MKDRQRKVSVIMTIYNQEPYLREAIESILDQTYKNMELVILDDGSTDKSIDIIREYADKDDRIVVFSRENRGRVKSLNEALRLATGEYIAIMDGDDISHKERIEKEVKYLELHRDVYMVGTKIELLLEGEMSEEEARYTQRYLAHVNGEFDRQNYFYEVDYYSFMHTAAILVKRELFQYIGDFQDYKCEDLEFFYRTIKAGFKVGRVDEILFTYRVHGGSRSSEKSPLKQDKTEFKLTYLEQQIDFGKEEFRYMIWGSDISGQYGYKKVQERFPNGKMVAYIDSFQEGEVDSIPVILPEKIKEYGTDYVFICTNGGGRYAKEYLDGIGMQIMNEYFKIV